MGKTKSGPMDHILQEQNGTIVRIQDPTEMNKVIIERNIQHFSQADGTPFTIEPMIEVTGLFGTTADCKDILNGTFNIEELNT
jgi:hypothetical protein